MTFLLGDRERLARFRAGDRDVLAEVYRHYLADVAQALRSGFSVRSSAGGVRIEGLTSAFDVECGCHEVFMRAFQPAARAAYDGERPYRNYLLRIARNWRIDRHRRTNALVSIDDVSELEAPPVDLAEDLDQHAVTALFDQFLASSPTRDAGYFRLRFREGLGQTEAAAQVGMTRIQGRRVEARMKERFLGFLRRHGHGGPR